MAPCCPSVPLHTAPRRLCTCHQGYKLFTQRNSLTVQPTGHKRSRGAQLLVAAVGGEDDPASADADAQLVAISQASLSIGLSGTIALSGAALCGISVASLLHWDSAAQDVELALLLNSVLLLLDAALLLPSYSIPDSLLLQPEQPSTTGSSRSTSSKQPEQPERLVDLAAVSDSSAWDPNSWRLMLALLREALTRPQLQQLPFPVSAGLLAAREASKELLQRAFVLTGLAGWLTDRLFEADVGGLEGVVTLPGLGVDCTVPELALLLASLAATALFAPGAFLAAEEAAGGVSGAMLLRTQAGATVAAAVAAGPASRRAGGRGGSDSSSSSSSSGGQQAAGAATVAVQEQERQDGSDDGSDEDDEPVDPEVLQYRLVKATEACLASVPPRLAYRLVLAKSLGRLALSNVVYVATAQNLAATYASGLLANMLLLVYARRGAAQREGVRGRGVN